MNAANDPKMPAHVSSDETAVASRAARIRAAAERALAEAEARRAAAPPAAPAPRELGGRDGPEPVRFGDWEKKGIASDF
ncbi:MAG: DUF1674 domain-containing protein [Pseudomonadota bacterium]